MYRVVIPFYDMQDGAYSYNVGDTFPRKGKVVSAERLAFLASNKTKHRKPVIEKVLPKKKKEE